MVPFRETITPSSLEDEQTASVQLSLPNKCDMKLRAKALPKAVVSLLDANAELIKRMYKSITKPLNEEESSLHCDDAEANRLRDALESAFESDGWGQMSNRILAFGPRNNGPNVLLNSSNLPLPNFWEPKGCVGREMSHLLSNAINGFQLATLAGPLCEEPLMGVCFVIEDLSLADGNRSEQSEENEAGQGLGGVSGQIISMVKDGCRRAFQLSPQRIMAAMYNCSIQVSGDVVGKLSVTYLLVKSYL